MGRALCKEKSNGSYYEKLGVYTYLRVLLGLLLLLLGRREVAGDDREEETKR